MTDEDNALMDAVFGRIRACVPEMDVEGRFHEAAQLAKVNKEYIEALRRGKSGWIAAAEKTRWITSRRSSIQ